MPVVTFTLLEGCSDMHLKSVLDSTHQALVQSGFAPSDRFQRVHVFKADHLIFDRSFPNLSTPRSDLFVLIEVLIGVGRSADFKKEMLTTIAENLQQSPGLDPNDVMIVISETERLNLSFAAGVQGLPVISSQ